MKLRERLMIFAFGALIGVLILVFTNSGKRKAIERQDALDEARGYQKEERFLPGQVIMANNPLNATQAIDVLEGEVDSESNTFLRVILAENPRNKDVIRFEELIWRDPENGRERLVSRRQMLADELIVRLNPKTASLPILQKIASGNSMKVLGPGRGPQLYRVSIEAKTVNDFTDSIERLISQKKYISRVTPQYILD